MEETWITDITHFLDERGCPADLPASAKNLINYLGAIVVSVSSQREGEPQRQTVRCRRRPGRRPCSGEILHIIDEETGAILWCCPVCKDTGAISNWEGTLWDCTAGSSVH